VLFVVASSCGTVHLGPGSLLLDSVAGALIELVTGALVLLLSDLLDEHILSKTTTINISTIAPPNVDPGGSSEVLPVKFPFES